MIVLHRNNAVTRARRLRAFAFLLLVAAALWAALMVFSAYRWFGYVNDGWLADVGDGTLYTTSWSTGNDDFTLRGWHSAPNILPGSNSTGVWTWWQWGQLNGISVGTFATFSEGYSIWPVSPLLAGMAATILFSLHRDRRRRQRMNLCFHCGYSLVGIRTGTSCPECGHTS